MTVRQRALAWLAGIGAFVFLLVVLGDVLLPFVIGMAVAYLLDPACDWLERSGCSRTAATVIITVTFFVVALLLLALLIPFLVGQLGDVAAQLPDYIQHFRGAIVSAMSYVEQRLGAEQFGKLREAFEAYTVDAVKIAARLAQQAVGGIDSFLGLLSMAFLVPIVTFYMLRDWDRMIAKMDGWLPRRQAPTIREQMRLIDATLAGFVRGQGTVCLLLGLFYAVGLSLVGLNSGFLIGLGTGLLSFIPFVGMLVGFVVGVGFAIVQFGEVVPVALVAGVFLLGQFIEGNFLTPKLVGGRVGLHPVWVIFALLAGGSLFGFLGVLLAVPIMAVIGVLARFAVRQYLDSPLYDANLPPQRGIEPGVGTAARSAGPGDPPGTGPEAPA